MKVICDWCGAEFERNPGRIKEHNYCSRACLGKANAERFRRGRIKTCEKCGRLFEYKGHHKGRNKHFFCSKKCADEFKVKRVEVNCDFCGKAFMKKNSSILRTDHNFCSEDCYRNYIEMMKEHKNGLVYDRKPLYRILMEDQLGRELIPDEEVHHIDGNHLNDSLDNLMVLSKSEHAKLHASQKQRNGNGRFKGGGEADGVQTPYVPGIRY